MTIYSASLVQSLIPRKILTTGLYFPTPYTQETAAWHAFAKPEDWSFIHSPSPQGDVSPFLEVSIQQRGLQDSKHEPEATQHACVLAEYGVLAGCAYLSLHSRASRNESLFVIT